MDATELVERAHDCLNRGDVDALVGLCSPEFELDMSERVFNPAVYRGHDGIRRFYAEVRNVWDEFTWEVEGIEPAGDRVVALLRARGRARGSGLTIDRRIAFMWGVTAGRAASLRLYVDRDEALAAAWLDR